MTCFYFIVFSWKIFNKKNGNLIFLLHWKVWASRLIVLAADSVEKEEKGELYPGLPRIEYPQTT